MFCDGVTRSRSDGDDLARRGDPNDCSCQERVFRVLWCRSYSVEPGRFSLVHGSESAKSGAGRNAGRTAPLDAVQVSL